MLFCQALVTGDRLHASPPGTGLPDGIAADVFVAPLPPFAILRDLVVDVAPFFDAFAQAEAWLEPAADYDGVVPRETFNRLWGPAGCVLCGICVGDAAAARGAHPAVVARILRLAHDPRDARGTGRLQGLDTPRICDEAFASRLRAICPKRVDVRGLLPSSAPGRQSS
jgi:succinate dehydrogenase / fumarate reductase iron-sulfur subunit